MKKLILCLTIAFVTCFFSCEKSEEENNGALAKNEYRIKRMEGHNKIWGDYQLLFFYTGERMDSVWRCDLNDNIIKRDTSGSFNFGYRGATQSAAIYDRVVAIDADSIERLRAAYPDTYQDTLRRRRSSVSFYSKNFDADKKIEKISKYLPRTDFGVGKEFNFNYLKDYVKTNLFEYDQSGKVIIVRQFYDTYVQDEQNNDYTRVGYKYLIEYENNRVVGVKYYIQDSHNDQSWSELDSYRLTYDSNKLISVEGNLYSMSRTANGITVKENGEVTTYTLDSNGNAVRVDYPDGSYTKMEYEKGAGNYSELLDPYISQILGKSIIK